MRPWEFDEKNRLNPRNGIALNAFQDMAFEAGCISTTPEYNIKISSQLNTRVENIQMAQH